jgi:hypothetical protein
MSSGLEGSFFLLSLSSFSFFFYKLTYRWLIRRRLIQALQFERNIRFSFEIGTDLLSGTTMSEDWFFPADVLDEACRGWPPPAGSPPAAWSVLVDDEDADGSSANACTTMVTSTSAENSPLQRSSNFHTSFLLVKNVDRFN